MTAGKSVKGGPMPGQGTAVQGYLDTLLETGAAANVSAVPEPQRAGIAAEPAVPASFPDAPAKRITGPRVPLWAEGRCDYLIFRVASSLRLSVPMAKLKGIIKWPQQPVTAVTSGPDWLIGSLTHSGKPVQVIDVGRVVIPAHHKARSSLNGKPGFSNIILIGDEGEWGIASDGWFDTVTLMDNSINWRRGEGGTRPWLAGLFADKSGVVLDLDQLIRSLQSNTNTN